MFHGQRRRDFDIRESPPEPVQKTQRISCPPFPLTHRLCSFTPCWHNWFHRSDNLQNEGGFYKAKEDSIKSCLPTENEFVFSLEYIKKFHISVVRFISCCQISSRLRNFKFYLQSRQVFFCSSQSQYQSQVFWFILFTLGSFVLVLY